MMTDRPELDLVSGAVEQDGRAPDDEAQELRQAGFYMVDAVPIERDKIGRLYVQQAKFEAGLVLFPRGAPFSKESAVPR
jgi:phage terminase large subunit-like protein